MLAATMTRTRRRRTPPVDAAAFRPQIEAAMQAFLTDVSYSVSMAKAATTIVRKRAVWQARRAEREALALSL